MPKVSLSKRKKSYTPILPWLGGTLLLLIGVGGITFYLTQRSKPVMALMEIAKALPQTTEVMVSFDPQSQSWQTLQQFGTPEARQIIDGLLQKSPLHSLLRQRQMSLAKDVQPWATTVASALINQKPTPATLLIATTRNRRASQEFLNQYRKAWGEQVTQQIYQGVTYFAATAPDRMEVTAELGDQYVVIATDPQALMQVIDVWKGMRPPLSQNASFERAIASQPLQRPIVQAFLQGSAALDLIQSKPDQPVTSTSQEPSAISLSVATTTTGLQMEVTTHLRNAAPTPIPNRPSQLTTVLPQNTFLLLSGRQLLESWRSMVKYTPVNSEAEKNLRQIREGIENSTQLSLEQDILPWMTGEFAIGAIPAQTGILEKNAGFGLVFLAETTDPDKAERFWQRLDELAVNSDGGVLPKGVTIVPEKQGTQGIATWKVGKSTAASRGALSNKVVFWAVGDLASTLSKPENLDSSEGFQQMTSTLPRENGGYFYLDIAVARDLFHRRIAPENWKTQDLYKETMTILESMRGVAVTQKVLNERTSRLDFALTLTPAPK